MTWKELRDKISHMTEEEQEKEVVISGEDFIIDKGCVLAKTDEAIYYDTTYDESFEESELEPGDFNNPDIYKVCEKGTYYILG